MIAKYWEDPYIFKPERFLGEWNRDAFLPFSGGEYLSVFRRNLNTHRSMKVTEHALEESECVDVILIYFCFEFCSGFQKRKEQLF